MKPVGISLYLGPSFGLVILFAAVAPLVAQAPSAHRGAQVTTRQYQAPLHMSTIPALAAAADRPLGRGQTPGITPLSIQPIDDLRR